MDSLNQMNTRVQKLFKNPQINFFIIMFLVLLITCYTLLSDSIKSIITIIISNPVVLVTCIGLILAIGYFDIGIASLMLILFFILLFGSSVSSNSNSSMFEGFKSARDARDNSQPEEEEDDTDEPANIDRHIKKITKTLTQSQKNLKAKEDKDKLLDERVNNIKGVVLGTINKIRNSNNDDYKQALLENKQAMLTEEHDNNTIRNPRSNGKDKFTNTGKRNGKRDNFQTVEVRALDPSNEEDTNLLITKEILQDMLNRIEYNYESNKYLRKYIKHRVEEIIEINKLAEDD